MEKKEILLQIIDYYTGGNQRQFASMLGVAPSTINSWVRRNTYDVDVLRAKCVDINAEYLLTGEGEMLLSQDSKTGENEEKKIQGVNKEDIDKLVARVDELVHTIGIMEQNRATEIERTQSLLSRMLSVVENMTASLQHHAPLHCTSLHSDAE